MTKVKNDKKVDKATVLAMLSAIFLGEKVGFRRWSAVIIGFVGSLIVIRPGFIEFNLATIAALGTGFFMVFTLLLLVNYIVLTVPY